MNHSRGRTRKIRKLMATEGLSYSDAAREYARRAPANSKPTSSPAPAGERWARLTVSPAMFKLAEQEAEHRRRLMAEASGRSSRLRKVMEEDARRRKEIADLMAPPAWLKLAEQEAEHRRRLMAEASGRSSRLRKVMEEDARRRKEIADLMAPPAWLKLVEQEAERQRKQIAHLIRRSFPA